MVECAAPGALCRSPTLHSNERRLPDNSVVTLYWGWMNSMAVLAVAWKWERTLIVAKMPGVMFVLMLYIVPTADLLLSHCGSLFKKKKLNGSPGKNGTRLTFGWRPPAKNLSPANTEGLPVSYVRICDVTKGCTRLNTFCSVHQQKKNQIKKRGRKRCHFPTSVRGVHWHTGCACGWKPWSSEVFSE